MRLFIAIPLGAEVQSELKAVVARSSPQADDWRWSRPESWHITLQFLGNTSPEKCAALAAGLREIRSDAISVQLGRLDLFDRAGVFFAEVVISPGLLALQQKVVGVTAQYGFVAESRPYHPHITLARAKNKARQQTLQALRQKVSQPATFTSFVSSEFLLYESFLGPGGSRYEVRERFPLA